MKKVMILISTVIICIFLLSYYISVGNGYNNLNSNNLEDSKMLAHSKVLGSTSYGEVTLEGPYGNKNSNVKVAYIVGVHPLEFASHKAIMQTVKDDNSLSYCYYIYRINVTEDASDYDNGRMNGQLLANKFAVPHIINGTYKLVVDVHSNQGQGEYSIRRFLFAPLDDAKSKSIALNVIGNIPDLRYYNPISQTSTQYVTVPVINSGTPTIVYETYLYDSYEVTKKHAIDFVKVIDRVQLR